MKSDQQKICAAGWCAAVVSIVALVLAPRASAAAMMSIDEAIAKVSLVHPDLRAFAVRHRILEREREQAALSAPLTADLAVENFGGRGDYSGKRAAETTLSLAGLLEGGDKKSARIALATARFDELEVERVAHEIDVAAEVARRYLDLAEAKERVILLRQSYARQQSLIEIMHKRYGDDSILETSVGSAELRARRTAADIEREARRVLTNWQALALMWGDKSAKDVPKVQGRATTLPRLQPLENLIPVISNAPTIRSITSAVRVQDACRRIADSTSQFDVTWRLGIRRFEATNDAALVAGISVPIGMQRRARIDTAIEEENSNLMMSARDAATQTAELALVRTHGDIATSIQRIEILSDMLAGASARLEKAGRSFSRGTLSYSDYVRLQDELTEIEFELVGLRFDIDRKLIELQRLTGNPIVAVVAGDLGGARSRPSPLP